MLHHQWSTEVGELRVAPAMAAVARTGHGLSRRLAARHFGGGVLRLIMAALAPPGCPCQPLFPRAAHRLAARDVPAAPRGPRMRQDRRRLCGSPPRHKLIGVFHGDEDIGPAFPDGDRLGHVCSPHFIDLIGDDRPIVRLGLGASNAMRREQAVLTHHPSHTAGGLARTQQVHRQTKASTRNTRGRGKGPSLRKSPRAYTWANDRAEGRFASPRDRRRPNLPPRTVLTVSGQ